MGHPGFSGWLKRTDNGNGKSDGEGKGKSDGNGFS